MDSDQHSSTCMYMHKEATKETRKQLLMFTSTLTDLEHVQVIDMARYIYILFINHYLANSWPTCGIITAM